MTFAEGFIMWLAQDKLGLTCIGTNEHGEYIMVSRSGLREPYSKEALKRSIFPL